MITEEQIRTYLENNAHRGEILKFEFTTPEKFTALLKCGIDRNRSKEYYDSYIENWVVNFSQFTATKWLAHSSYVKIKTMVLQKVFVCQVADNNISKEEQPLYKCGAQIDFKIKIIDLNEDLNLFITIHFVHTHNVYTPVTSSDGAFSKTDKLFFEYFENGFNALTSKTYHELSLIEKYGKTSAQYLEDPAVNPSMDKIKYLIDQMQSKEIRRSFTDILEAKKAFIQDSDGLLSYSKKPEQVVVITPLMKKVIMNNSMDIVVVDSSVVKAGLVVTYLYVSNKIGALPIACLLHTATTKANFKDAFKRFKQTIKNVKNSFHPKVFLVNDILEQKQALFECFQRSRLYISRWSVCSDIWKWLCNENPSLNFKKRHSVMYLFKALVYAPPHRAREFYMKLATCNFVSSNPRMMRYLDYIWGKSPNWQGLPNSQLHDLTEPSIRLLKEFLLRKCRFFNIIMMIDVVSKLLEDHQNSLIIKYVDGMPKISNYTKFFHCSYLSRSNEEFVQIRLNQYMIQYQNSPNIFHYLQTDTACCDCTMGELGRLCDHLGIMFTKSSAKVLMVPLLNNMEMENLVNMSRRGNSNTDNTREPSNEIHNAGLIVSAANWDPDADYLNNNQVGCTHENDGLLMNSNEDSNIPGALTDIEEEADTPDEIEVTPSTSTGSTTPVEATGKKRKFSAMQKYEKTFMQVCKRFQRLQIAFLMHPNNTNQTTMKELSRKMADMNLNIKPNENADGGYEDDSKKKRHDETTTGQ